MFAVALLVGWGIVRTTTFRRAGRVSGPPPHPSWRPLIAERVPLTAGLSMAVDRRYIPLGMPVYLRTLDPLKQQPLERLMVAQDTGGAIRGAVRADLFWGQGAEAGARAGRMRHQGNLWLLWPKGAPLPSP